MLPLQIAMLTFRKRLLPFALITGAFVVLAAKKIFDFAAPPLRVKNCDFIFPGTPGQIRPAVMRMSVAPGPYALDQTGGYINDASCLNKTAIYGVVKVKTVEDVAHALQFARENRLKVTSAGQRHSMGGQSFIKDGLVVDMRGMNQLQLDKEQKILTVQAGATWEQVQQFLDPQGLAVQAMQSINIFTVGGTLSVNAHGIAHDPGPVAGTVKSFRIMLSTGEIKVASPDENPELFRLAMGGYGLFGVLLDVRLQLVSNEMYELNTQYLDYRDFPAYYREHISGNRNVGLIYGRLSVSPSGFLRETAVHTYTKTEYAGELPPLRMPRHVWLDRLVINFSKTGATGRTVRWGLEKYLGPREHACVSRNQAMNQKEPCLVSRNQEMYDPMGYLKNRLSDTDILQEYFIPPEKMADFIDALRESVVRNKANLLNVTLRIVHKDTITAMPYAKQDMFAFVLYFNQKLNEKESLVLKKTTSELIDAALRLDGTYYLPYQLFYTQAQLRKAYPGSDEFFAAKKKYDPEELFMNNFYQKYGRANRAGE
ncbi:MAG TPA: FAD-binding oxidoreductase [Candidatus Angelobacter sp.]|nr:FAD-binding oxidoreductase [Candidatus Angelobacter sp.]